MIAVQWSSGAPRGDFEYQTFFQSEAYARLLDSDNRRSRWLVATDASGAPSARWLLFEQPRNYLNPPPSAFGRLLDVNLVANHSPALCAEMDNCSRKKVWSAIIGFVVRHAKRNRPVSTTLRLDPLMPDSDLTLWRELAALHGMRTEESWSYVSDLPADPAVMFQRIRSDRRTKIRKGETDGLRFEVGTDLDALKAYFEVRCDSASRNGVGSVPWRHFQAAYETLGMQGPNRVFLVKHGNRTAAAQLALIDRGFVTLNGVSIASWTFDEKIPANDVLQWRIIEWSIHQRMKHIDYVGADPNTSDPKIKAIDHFKSRWGTTLRKSLVLHGDGSRLRHIGCRLAAMAGL